MRYASGIDSVADIVESNTHRRKDNKMDACLECLRSAFDVESQVALSDSKCTALKNCRHPITGHRKLFTSLVSFDVICIPLGLLCRSCCVFFFCRLIGVYS